jgi:hypothetical protein
VIVAAVAAVMPDVRIVSIAPEPAQSLWRTSGLMRNVFSHQIGNPRNTRNPSQS